MDDYTKILQAQHDFFATGKTKELSFRMDALSKLEKGILKYQDDILEALKLDLNKAAFESYATELGVVLDEIRYAKKHLKHWMKPRRVHGNLKNFPSHGIRYPEPYGIALIMAPWNYPFQLMIDPLVAAISAGNCVILKPSEYSVATTNVIKKICQEIFNSSYIAVIEGGSEESAQLLKQHFDTIFFTGSSAVGRIVMTAASQFLTPVTLELGGKSPCIVDETANIKLAAKRIVWGKFLNAGQTCVAPDYLLVHESVKDELIKEIKINIEKMYGNSLENPDFPKIINEKHFQRLLRLIKNEKLIIGGKSDAVKNKIAPTLLELDLAKAWNFPVMQEEIFGPILPIIAYQHQAELVEAVTNQPKPLATYIFTNSKSSEEFLLKALSFGGGCVNDTVVHVASTNLPFGGVGSSGMGSYHGKQGFVTFSHIKSILYKSRSLDLPLRYMPYKEKWFKLLKKL